MIPLPSAIILSSLLLNFLPESAPPTDAGGAGTDNQQALRILDSHLPIRHGEIGQDPLAVAQWALRHEAPPILAAALARPLEAPYRAGVATERLARHADSPHRLLLHLAGIAGIEVATGAIGNPLREADALLRREADPLAVALAPLAGEAPDPARLPSPWREEVARLLLAIAEADEHRRQAFRRVDLPSAEELRRAAQGAPATLAEEHRLHDALRALDRESLAAGALLLAAAIEDFIAILPELPAPPSVTFPTRLGPVVIDAAPTSAGIGAVADGPPLLYIRIGGDDSHAHPGWQPDRPIRIVIDTDGHDEHRGASVGGMGGAIAGYDFLADLGGDDRYASPALAQGAALLGVGVLLDAAGDDAYAGLVAVQGHGTAGLGLLVDLGGADRYRSVTESQGCGGPRGAGLLVDATGDDHYLLSDEPLLRPAAQLPQRNSSAGQGAGMGVRRDLTHGHSLAGGVGILLDGSGNDHYEASVYAQGAGFWGGYGLLVDEAGDDRYLAAYYAQGAAAHRAFGGLLDRAGNDQYTVTTQVSHGGAHDFSVAFLVDEAGDDRYHAGPMSLGGAFENGIALFVDAGGDDHYAVTRGRVNTFGAAELLHTGTVRESSLGIGIFFDLGGRDRYETERDGPTDGGIWTRPWTDPRLRAELGLGLDAELPNPFRTRARTPVSNHEQRVVREATEARRAWRKPSPDP